MDRIAGGLETTSNATTSDARVRTWEMAKTGIWMKTTSIFATNLCATRCWLFWSRGFEYQHMGFGVPNTALIPDRLDMLTGVVGIDFRWSEKDLLHIEGRPGLYTDWRGSGETPSIRLGDRLDTGHEPALPVGDGVQLEYVARQPLSRRGRFSLANEGPLKLKFYLPTPGIEYSARPDLTLLFGGGHPWRELSSGPSFWRLPRRSRAQ